MAKEVIMPALGMAQDVGLLIQWLKAEGETVKAGEPLMEIETDKSTVEVEAPASGVLAQVTAEPGDSVPVGQTIAWILAPNETAPAAAKPASAQVASSQVEARSGPAVSPVAARMAAEHQVDLSQVKPDGGRIQKADVMAYLAQQSSDAGAGQQTKTNGGRSLASPKARRLAADHALDLKLISGSGPEGAVLAADVLRAVEAQAVVPEPVAVPASIPAQPGETMTVSRTWQIMAQRLTQSWSEVPHFYLVREVNAGALIDWRTQAQARLNEKLTYNDLLV
jgi:pyruvate dehydrogenase E2 component (dihydrolipoamide acetyltransferase)